MKLSIIMPAYNERKTLREIVGRVLAVDLGSLERELVIVDDGSTDGTRDILRELDGREDATFGLKCKTREECGPCERRAPTGSSSARASSWRGA